MKQLLFILAVASSTIALWIALGSDRDEAPTPAELPWHGSAPFQDGEPLEPARGARVEAAEPDRADPLPALPAAPEPTPAAAAGDDRVLLRGTIVVTDRDGIEHPHTAGQLTVFEFENQDFGIGREAVVQNGVFELELGATSEFQVGSATLEEQPVSIDDGRTSGRHPLPADLFLALRGSWGGALVLEVKDAETGAHLDGITLVRGAGFFLDRGAHPEAVAAASPLLEDGVSPLDLSTASFPFPGAQDLHVHSPGYAWGKVRVDSIAGGEHLIVLRRGAELEVSLSEEAPRGAEFILQSDPESAPVFQAPVAGKDRLVVEGLPTGDLTARVLLGEWYRGPQVLAQAPVQLAPGGTHALDLELETLETPDRVSVRGVLSVPLEWEVDDPVLEVELRDVPLDGGDRTRSPELEKTEPGRYTFAFEGAQPGLYQATVRERGARLARSASGLRYAFGFEVGQEGEDDLWLEVPPPATVIARVVDEAGAPVELNVLMWSPRLPGGVRGGALNNVTVDPETGTHRFRAPVGQLRFRVHGGYSLTEPSSGDVTIHPGENHFELEAQRLYELTLVLRDGDTVVPWNRAWKAELQPVEGEGRKNGWGSRGGNYYLIVDRAARYRLELSELPGYDPVPAVELEIGPGGVREHVVELKRAR